MNGANDRAGAGTRPLVAGFIKAMRTPDGLTLVRDCPLALAVLYLAARRAKWNNAPDGSGLRRGEALMGDIGNLGMTRKQYRGCLDNLRKRGYIETRKATRGTVVRITNAAIFDIGGATSGSDATPCETGEYNDENFEQGHIGATSRATSRATSDNDTTYCAANGYEDKKNEQGHIKGHIEGHQNGENAFVNDGGAMNCDGPKKYKKGIIRNTDKENEKKEARAHKRLHLDFIELTDLELDKLKADFGDDRTQAMIRELNNAIGSKGLKYQSHYFTLRSWISRDCKKGGHHERGTSTSNGANRRDRYRPGGGTGDLDSQDFPDDTPRD